MVSVKISEFRRITLQFCYSALILARQQKLLDGYCALIAASEQAINTAQFISSLQDGVETFAFHIQGRGYAVAQWLRHCAKNRKVTGSIPDGVIGILH
jgi:hypothetical protein